MQEVSVVIPNFNGMAYLDGVLSSLERQTIRNFEVILVDNGSTDGSCAFVSAEYPWVHMIQLPENYGFSRAVNEGIHAARSPYVLLLNNDTEAEPDFLEEMVAALRRHKKAFSCQAKMIQLHDHDKMDDAGNYYCALGWAFARGKDKDINHYDKEQKIFSACKVDGFAFDFEAIMTAVALGYTIGEIPVKIVNHRASKVHVFSDSLKMLRDLADIRRRVRARHRAK